MNAKHKFREGWIVLKRPFRFAELGNPLQNLTILYAYSEKPMIELGLTEKGEEELKIANENIGKGIGYIGAEGQYWRKRFGEDDDDYSVRINEQLSLLFRNHKTIENYIGEIVQCYIEGQMCRFFPGEYNIISQELFEEVLQGDDYFFKIESPGAFNMKEIRDKVHYIQSRGIPLDKAKQLSSAGLKDNIYFKPKLGILSIFTREDHVYLPDSDYPGITRENLHEIEVEIEDKHDLVFL